jgi:uncharacterized protein with NRDE domain
MCLIVFGYKTIPGYRLILAANRDEFYERPTRAARFWESDPSLLAGKDLVAGGTWLGVHKNGRIAALTNYRKMNSHNPDARSRGHLATSFLQSRLPAEEFLSAIADPENYNGFNLLAGDAQSFYHYSNITNHSTPIEPGIHGISNALMNTPWPKVEKAKQEFRNLMKSGSLHEEHLFRLLANSDTYPSDQLPETGLSSELEKAVSAIFIRTQNYGSRCSTVVRIKENGDVRFTERVFKPGATSIEEENSFEFTLNAQKDSAG